MVKENIFFNHRLNPQAPVSGNIIPQRPSLGLSILVFVSLLLAFKMLCFTNLSPLDNVNLATWQKLAISDCNFEYIN